MTRTIQLHPSPEDSYHLLWEERNIHPGDEIHLILPGDLRESLPSLLAGRDALRKRFQETVSIWIILPDGECLPI